MTCRKLITVLCFPALSLMLAAGCSKDQYKARADKEVYKIISDKTPDVPGMLPEFTIEGTDVEPLAGDFPTISSIDEYMGEAGDAERDAQVLSLEKALEIAFTHSRNYQTQKELLYLSALSLTLDRHDFAPIFAAGAQADYVRSTTDVSKLSGSAQLASAIPGWISQQAGVISTSLGNAGTTAALLQALGTPANSPAVLFLEGINDVAGTPGTLLNNYAAVVDEAFTVAGVNQPRNEIMNERSVDGGFSVGVNMLMKGGARIALQLSSDFLRFLTGDPRVNTGSALTASVVQPLLRGAGSKVTLEQLKQSERDVLYQLRDFTNFRKDFAVQIASDYFAVLQARDSVRINYLGYQAFKRAADRDRAFFDEGQRNAEDLGRSEQAELNAENSWINAIRSYRRVLDQFKIDLGLPVDAKVVMDYSELESLIAKGVSPTSISVDDAIKVAFAARLDLYTVRDQLEDAGRRVDVAANGLLPDLDLVLTARVNSVPGEDTFNELDFQRALWTAGVDLGLPLDRKAERNSYVSSLIALSRSERELTLAEDTVKLEIRENWRALDQTRRNYENRQIALELSQRRVELNNLLTELGRGTALNQIDAQNDFINAQNDLTDAVVSHFITRLQFWRDMGILYIKENGQWQDISDENLNTVQQSTENEVPVP